MSFGSALEGHISEALEDILVKVLGKLQQLVIWKHSLNHTKFADELPENIHTFDWIPQNDIVGMSVVFLFISFVLFPDYFLML